MNAPAKIEVPAPPASSDFRQLWREQSDRRQAAEAKCVDLRIDALVLAWAMQGLCKRAEEAGIDVTYWREKAAEVDGRLR